MVSHTLPMPASALDAAHRSNRFGDILKSRMHAYLFASLLTLSPLVGCASLSAGTYQDAVARWQLGDPASATAAANAHYIKVRDDNGLTEDQVASASKAALDTLESEPVLPTAASSRPTPTAAANDTTDELVTELRADLLSDRVTAVVRAAVVVQDFGLSSEFPTLLAVVYRRAALVDDGGVLGAPASVALRSVAAKWVALRALEKLARMPFRPNAAIPHQR